MRIAVDIGNTVATAWKIASGALDYERSTKEEVIILLPHAAMSRPEDKDSDSWDAVITNTPKPELDIPQVYVSSNDIEGYTRVTIDNNRVAKLAVDQFVSMGLTSLAFFGNPGWGACTSRWNSFEKYMCDLGMDPLYLNPENFGDVLSKLKKPCGIMTFNDQLGVQLIKHCKKVGLQVPREVQIISVDDSPVCMEVTPTLSSISMPLGLIGYHAAKLCAQMVNGEKVESLQLPASGLIIRESIEIQSEDIRTASAIAHYLRANVSYPIQMEDLVRRSSMSRRRLEQIFQSNYGSSPIAYLRELRVEQAKKMLETSDAPLKDIVDACGYTSSIHLCRMFKRHTGLSPMTYRESHSAEKD